MDASGFQRIARGLEAELAPYGAARERALQAARELVRHSADHIRDVHRGRPGVRRELEQAAQALGAIVRPHPFLRSHGAVEQAFQEYVEARLFEALQRDERPPTARALKVPAGSYLLGMADLVGELRRSCLQALLEGEAERARAAFDAMEKVYEALRAINVPEALVPLRSKLDAARGQVERTRGELVTAQQNRDLERKIDDLTRLLDEAEGPKKKAKARAAPDLDLDAAWNKD